MNALSELAYCRQRENEEMTAAVSTEDVCARDAHLVMAEFYAARIKMFEKGIGYHA